MEGHRFSIGQADTASSGRMARHRHEDIEIVYIKSGWLTLHVEDVTFSLAAGEAVIIPPNLWHWTERSVERPFAYGTVSFSTSLFNGHGYRRLVRPLVLDGRAFVLKLSEEIGWQKEALLVLRELMLFKDRPDGIESWQLEFHGLILIFWNKVYNHLYADSPAVQAYQKLYNRLLGAVNYIHAHYMEGISDGILAKQVNMAVGTFCRYFKRLFGVTPIQYINKYRILKSRELLVNTERKVSEIAFMCGYNNLSNFNREFKKYMGTTPSKYRGK
ncbi:MAG: AraC family transcriptional regulator [Oscillospiraceae bacterium]|nr:AraC family transcriptional regulator [Oscillospiraceae bacterium]